MKKKFLLLIIFFTIFIFSKQGETKAQTLTQANFTGVIVPKYLISGNTTRMPVVYRATVTKLKKSAKYRYFNQLVLRSDFGTASSGSGSVVFMDPAMFLMPTLYNFTTAGNYAEFTTDTSGSYTGWFCNINSTGFRFNAGNSLFPALILNDGAGGTSVAARYALNDSIRVMAFNTTTGVNNASGIWGTSSASGKNIILLFDNINGTGRPVAATYAENEALINANAPAYYASNVDAKNGAWGTIMPNNNANGIRRIEQISNATAVMVGCATDDDGVWPTGKINTINPTAGVTAVGISSTDAPLNNCSPVVTVTSNIISRSNVRQGTNDVILYNLNLYPNVLGTVLDSLIITMSGSYIPSDIKSNGLKLWFSPDAVLGTGDIPLDTIASAIPGTITFIPKLNLPVHNTAYLFITADISSTAFIGDSIYVSAIPFTGIRLRSGTKIGTNPVPASGAATIISATSPLINASALLPFGNVPVHTSSTEQSFTITGTYLSPVSGNVIITPPANFEVSFTSGSGYSSLPIIKAYSSGNLASTIIYVIFKPTSIKTYSGFIHIVGGTTSADVTVSGTGSPDVTPPKADTAFATSLTIVKVVFSEPVDNTAEIALNYSGLGTITSAIRCPTLDTVTLTLVTSLSPGIPKTLSINSVQDTSHNPMAGPKNFQIKFGTVPQAPTYKIIQVRGMNANGVPDSANVKCKLRGVVQSINYSQPGQGHSFFIHDGTGGIRVFRNTNPFLTYTVRRGDSIRVIGTITSVAGVIQITTDSMKVIDSFQTVRVPTVVKKLNETTEAEVVKIKCLHLINPIQWPTTAGMPRSVQATNGVDTVTIRIERTCNLQGTPAPAYLFDITGIGAQNDYTSPYLSSYWMLPRDTFDLNRYPYPGAIVLNEFMANSTKTDGWVEIFNPNPAPVYMYKFHLSDDPLTPNKYAFPDTASIPANNYLLVWDNTNLANPGLHFNFKLKSGGGELVLSDYKATTVNDVIYGAQKKDTTFARIPNGTGNFVYAWPTPNTKNSMYPVNIPSYPISQLKHNNPDGEADSVNTYCRLTGAVFSINYRTWKPGYMFTLHDPTGGICVYKFDLPFGNYPTVKMGDWVRVIGTIAQSNGMLRIIPDSIIKLDTNHVINTPWIVTSLNENLESELIRINNLSLTDTINYPWPKATDNAKDVKATNGTTIFTIHIEPDCALHGKFGYKAPKKKFDIIGIGWQDDNNLPYTSNYMIYPRISSDLILQTRIDENDLKSQIRIYPNPNHGNFNIENNYGRIAVSVYNSMGQIVLEKSTSENRINMNLDVSKGVYFIKVESVDKKEAFYSRMLVTE